MGSDVTLCAIADKPLFRFYSGLNVQLVIQSWLICGYKTLNFIWICDVINEPKSSIMQLITAMAIIVPMVPIDGMVVGVGFRGFCHQRGSFCGLQQSSCAHLDAEEATIFLNISLAILYYAICSENNMQSLISKENMCNYSFGTFSGDGLARHH